MSPPRVRHSPFSVPRRADLRGRNRQGHGRQKADGKHRNNYRVFAHDREAKPGRPGGQLIFRGSAILATPPVKRALLIIPLLVATVAGLLWLRLLSVPLGAIVHGGSGPPTLVLLHGYGSRAEDWLQFEPKLSLPGNTRARLSAGAAARPARPAGAAGGG